MSTTNDEFLTYWTSIETDTRKALILGARTDTEKLHDLLRTVYEAGAKREASPLPAAQGELSTLPRPAKHGDIPKPWAYFTAEQMQEWGASQRQEGRRDLVEKLRAALKASAQGMGSYGRKYDGNTLGPAIEEILATPAPTAAEGSAK